MSGESMGLPQDVRSHFSGSDFGPACSEAEIRRAEVALGEEIPQPIRELYLAFNGFRGPTNASFFWPLFAPDHGGLVEMNTYLRQAEAFPGDLVSQVIFFGDNGIGAQWGLKNDLAGKVIQWDARWGRDFEIVGDTPLEAWLAEKKLYDELGGQK